MFLTVEVSSNCTLSAFEDLVGHVGVGEVRRRVDVPGPAVVRAGPDRRGGRFRYGQVHLAGILGTENGWRKVATPRLALTVQPFVPDGAPP